MSVASDADLPWLTKKGAPRKQPPQVSYVVYLGLFGPRELARALCPGIDAAGDFEAGDRREESAFARSLARELARSSGRQALGRLLVDRYGVPVPGTYRCSPVVWAAGRAARQDRDTPSPIPDPRELGGIAPSGDPARILGGRELKDQPEEGQPQDGREPQEEPVRVGGLGDSLTRLAAEYGLSGLVFEAAVELYSVPEATPEAPEGLEAIIGASSGGQAEFDRLAILRTLYRRRAGATAARGRGASARSGIGHDADTIPGPRAALEAYLGAGLSPGAPVSGFASSERDLAHALCTRRVPLGKWTAGGGQPAVQDKEAPEAPEGAEGAEGAKRGVRHPRSGASAETGAGAGLGTGREPVSPQAADVAAARRALHSLLAQPRSDEPGALYRLDCAPNSQTGPDSAAGPDPRLVARELASGVFVERARALADLEEPGRAFGLRPSVSFRDELEPDQRQHQQHDHHGDPSHRRVSLQAWSVTPGLGGWEVIVRRPSGRAERPASAEDPPSAPSAPTAPSTSWTSFTAAPNALLPRLLPLGDPAALGELAAGLERSLARRERELRGEEAPGYGPEDPLLAAYDDARDRFRESLAAVETCLEEVRAVEADVEARAGRRHTLAELDRRVRDKQADLEEAKSELARDATELERSDAALYEAKTRLDAAEAARPGLARRILAPQADARWREACDEARQDFDACAQRALADNRVYEETDDECRELSEELTEATRRRRHCAGRMALAEDRISRTVARTTTPAGSATDNAGEPPNGAGIEGAVFLSLPEAATDERTGKTDEPGEANATGTGLWPLPELDAQREALFDRACELHEAFAVINRRYLVDNLNLLARLLADPERSLDDAAGPPDARPEAALATDLLRSAALLAPVIGLDPDRCPRLPELFASTDPASLGAFVDGPGAQVGAGDGTNRPQGPQGPQGGEGDEARPDLTTVASLHAARVGLVAPFNEGSAGNEVEEAEKPDEPNEPNGSQGLRGGPGSGELPEEADG